MDPRHTALGVILGGGLGLLCDSLLVLWLRVPILYFVFFSLGLVLIAPVATGIGLGLTLVRETVQQPWSWPGLIALAVVVWPTAIVLPFAARMVQMRWAAVRRVPTYPGARRATIRVRLGDNENTADEVHLHFMAQADPAAVVDFFYRELARRHWEPGPAHFVEHQTDGTPHWFTPKGMRCCRSMHIRLRDPQPDGQPYEVVYQPDGLLGF